MRWCVPVCVCIHEASVVCVCDCISRHRLSDLFVPEKTEWMSEKASINIFVELLSDDPHESGL